MSSAARRLATKLLGRCAALGVAGQLLFPSPALAADPPMAFGGGLYVSFSFGEKVGFGYGVEGYATYLVAGEPSSCLSGPRAGFGPLLRVGTVNLQPPRLTLSLAGGGEVDGDSRLALLGEAGVTYRFGQRSRFGFHVGAGPEITYFHPFVRADVGLDEYEVGMAVRTSSLFGEPTGVCVAGRSLRDAHGVTMRGPGLAARDPAIRAWADDAEEECASVLAFAELAEQLVIAGAPTALVSRALAAGAEEIGHARGCATMVERLAGHAFTPRAPLHARRAPLVGDAALARLAIESWTDGCVGEGVAARWASGAADRATRTSTPGARLQQRIAREEAAHAALAWDVLAWAARTGGDDVRHALWSRRALEPAARADDDDDDARTARLPQAERASLLDAHVADSRRRLDAVLRA